MEAAANLDAHKSAGRRPVDDASVTRRKGRSKITNGKVLIAGVDQRSPWVRRAKDVIAAHIADLGGPDNCSAAERSIIRRASTLTVELERMETAFATAGEASPLDLEVYQRCANSLRRLLEAVGLQRRARSVGQFVDGASKTIEAEFSPLRSRWAAEPERTEGSEPEAAS